MQSVETVKGTLQVILLKILRDNGKMYGYEITQRVRELSDGKILVTEGALYPTLHKLESEGLMKTETATVGGRIRKYYSLTPAGRSVVKERLSELQTFILTIANVLQLRLS